MTARKVGLLILILGFGGIVETVSGVRNHVDLGPEGCRVLGGRFYGRSFAFEQEQVAPVAAETRVEVDNAFGAVALSAGAPGQVKVKLRKVVFLPTEAKARDFAGQIQVQLTTVGQTLRITTNRPVLSRQNDDVGFETHLTIEVPPQTAATVRNEHGRIDVVDVAEAQVDGSFEPVHVENVKGAAEVTSRHGSVEVTKVGGALSVVARHGDVEVTDVAGRVTLDVQHGDVRVARAGGITLELAHGEVNLEAIAGNVEVRAKHAPVRATDVRGNVLMETSYNDVDVTNVTGEARLKAEHGEVLATDVKGAVVAEATFNDVTLDGVGGPVQVEVSHGGLRAHALGKGARVKASGDDVSLDDFQGPVEIESRGGSVHLMPRGGLTEPLTVSTDGGGIRLQVPAGSRFDLEASAERGEIEIDVPGFTMNRTEKGRVSGTLGGGRNPVKLSAEGGDVTLESTARSAKDES